jgi:repressor LexA
MLTKKQHELLMFINQRLAATGVAPSFDEMKDALNLRSKSGIHRLISGLEERGFIRRLPHRARALEVTRLPEESAAAPVAVGGIERGRFSPTVIRGDFAGALPGTPVAPDTVAVDLPLYGRIAAGTPIEALRDQNSSVGVPGSLVGRGEHYALEVAGDSMVEAGILDGDYALIRRTEVARDGEIVVALIDDAEATLKYFRKEGAMIRLDPANRDYSAQRYRPDQVRVQGRLAGLLRRY